MTLWGVLIPLSSAAVAPGTVNVEGYRKSIQHLEGGLVKTINVKEGQQVNKGDTLFTLEDSRIRTEYEALKSQLALALARQVRWQAEYDTTPNLLASASLQQLIPADGIKSLLSEQSSLHDSRADVFKEKQQILQHRIQKTQAEQEGNTQQLNELTAQQHLLRRELADYQRLEKQGLITRSQIFSLKRDQSDLKVRIDDARTRIQVAQKQIAELEASQEELRRTRFQESAEQLDKLKDEISQLQERYSKTKTQLDRTEARAPIDGYIVNLKLHTTGGVVASGETVMEIVPSQDNLMVEARVATKDRDSIQLGQTAEVRFSAFNRRSTLPVKGMVAVISADSVLDPTTKTSYYKTNIQLTEDPEKILGGAKIHPGMQADVVIITGERTMIDYLVSPISRSFNRALREN